MTKKVDTGVKWLHKVYEEGKICNLKGLELEDNPYEPGTIMWVSWEAGWNSVKSNESANEGC